MLKEYKITLDIMDNVRNPSFAVNTNDLDSFKLIMTVKKQNKPVDLSGLTAKIAILKPDRKTVFQECEITDAENGKVEVVLTSQAYIVPGTHSAELMLYGPDGLVAVTCRFSYGSVKGIMDDDTVESSDEWQAIHKKVDEAQAILDDLRENGTGIDAQARTQLQVLNEKVDENHQQLNAQLAQIATNVKSVFGTGDISLPLQNYLNNISNYDSLELYFPKGIYNLDNINVPDNVHFKGDGEHTVIKSKNIATIFRAENKKNIIFENLLIDGDKNNKSYSSEAHGILFVDCFNSLVVNCHFRNIVSEGVFIQGTSYFVRVKGNTFRNIGHSSVATTGVGIAIIEDNDITECAGNFISINSKGAKVRNNYIHGVGQYTDFYPFGLTLGQPNSNKAFECIIDSNTFDGVNGGINIENGSDNNRITKNTIINVQRFYGINVASEGNQVIGNYINTVLETSDEAENSGKGISVTSNNNLISDNNIRNCAKDGIALYLANQNIIKGNISKLNGRHGIVYQGNENIISENIITHNLNGIRGNSANTNTLVSNNICKDNTNKNIDLLSPNSGFSNFNESQLKGQITLNGTTNVRINHNQGRTSYMVILTPLSNMNGKLIIQKYNNDVDIRSTDASDVGTIVDYQIIN